MANDSEMLDKESIVYTKVKYLISVAYPKALFTTGTPQVTPTAFPCIVIKQVDNPITSTDLEGNEDAVTSYIQIEIYMNTDSALSTSRAVAKIADGAMKGMYYGRTYGFAQEPNATDTSILKRVGRYSRVIADGDTV